MKLAIFGRLTENTDFALFRKFLTYLKEGGIGYGVHELYARQIRSHLEGYEIWVEPYLIGRVEQLPDYDFAYSFGGDGTFLNTVRFIEGRLPVLGINFGRLGFLTSITQEELFQATDELQRSMHRIERRHGLMVESHPKGLFGEANFGLNDLTIHKSQSNEMITVHTYINGEFLNSYWGDGLIISTPTGSTAYNLACGGPFIHPRSNCFVITPVAPHSLTVRPMIIPDSYVVSFEIESRTRQAMIALDTRTELINQRVELAVRKSDFEVKLLRVASGNYLNTLRGKLMWGRDSRN